MKPVRRALLVVLLAFALSGQRAHGQNCIVSGRVTNAVTGEPVRKVKLHLIPTFGTTEASAEAPAGNERTRPAYFTWSDADGSFAFTGIEAGTYNLSGDHLGFIQIAYGAKKQGERGSTLVARAGRPITGLTFMLIPGAVISGRVTDDDGDPVPMAQVQVMVQSWNNGKIRYAGRSASSVDDRGEFRISPLEAGTYVLSAQKRISFRMGTEMDGKPQTNFVPTFYPAAANAESATPIHIQAGQQISDIEIRLHAAPSFHIRGQVAGAGNGARQGRMMLSIMPDANEGFRSRWFAQVKEDGTFDVSGVAPGTYHLATMARAGGGPSEAVLSQIVTVTSEDINDVSLSPRQVISVHGQVRVTGTPPAGAKPWNPSRFHLILRTVNMFGGPMKGGTSATTKADGSFLIDNVAPDVYSLETSGTPDGAYLQSVRFNGEEVSGGKVDLTRGTSGELAMSFRYGAPELVLKTKAAPAQMDGGVRPPPPQFFVVPDPAREDGSGVEGRDADDNGNSTFKGLTPGTYRAFAFEEIAPGAFENPAFLKAVAATGTPVELKEGDRKQVDLPLITADEMHQILAKLGTNAE